MQHVQEMDLAWSLIEAAKPVLELRERNHVFISVGAGDSFTAIRISLKLIAVKQINLRPHLVKLCTTWLEAYSSHDDHAQLAGLIDGLTVSATAPRPQSISGVFKYAKNTAALMISSDASCSSGVVARAG